MSNVIWKHTPMTAGTEDSKIDPLHIPRNVFGEFYEESFLLEELPRAGSIINSGEGLPGMVQNVDCPM